MTRKTMKAMTKKTPSRLIAALVCGVALCAQSVRAQVALTGTNYIQNFDAISNGLPAGWSVRTNATATSLGTAAPFITNTASWALGTGEFGNSAGTTNNSGTAANSSDSSTSQAAYTNRCPSVCQTGSFGDAGAAFVFQITNTIGLSNLTFTVDLNMLHEQTRSTTWTIDYAVSNSPSSFTQLGTYSDPGVFGTTTQTYNLGSDANNQTNNVWIRVVALSASTGSGSRDTFGIDNFILNYAGTSIAPIPLYIQLIGTNAVLTWSNSAFVLQTAPLATGTYTNITGAASPFTNGVDSPTKFYRLVH
jgi:hypothetical protein